MRKHILCAAVILPAVVATAWGSKAAAPAPVESPTTPEVVVSEASDPYEDHRVNVDPDALPTVDNTRIDRSDPSDVAKQFVRLSTTFAPDVVVDERDQVERGYPLTTRHYRATHKPLETNPDIVRIRSWYNQSTSDSDPVEIVESIVGWATRPVPASDDDERLVRNIQSVQIPVTTSGRELPERILEWQVTVLKQDDGTWLVDDATSEYVEKDS